MTQAAEIASLDWPESLVIETIADCYDRPSSAVGLKATVRMHAAFLRGLVDGAHAGTASRRHELMTGCAAHGVGGAEIEAADLAVFRELMRLAQVRFRNSPRARLHYLGRLQAALAQIASVAPVERPNRSVPVAARAPLHLIAA